jgi:hypothetical protein
MEYKQTIEDIINEYLETQMNNDTPTMQSELRELLNTNSDELDYYVQPAFIQHNDVTKLEVHLIPNSMDMDEVNQADIILSDWKVSTINWKN